MDSVKANTNNSFSGNVLNAWVEQGLSSIFNRYSLDDLKDFLEASNKPEFGKTGKYKFECKDCIGFWRFEDKRYLDFFRILHRYGQCGYEYQPYKIEQKNKKAEDGIKIKTGLVQKITTRSLTSFGLPINEILEKYIQFKETPVPIDTEGTEVISNESIQIKEPVPTESEN